MSTLGMGKVSLKLNSWKNPSLQNILHIPDISRNLIFFDLLNRAGVTVTFDSGKAIVIKGGEFVGKRFCHGGPFVLIFVVENKMNALLISLSLSLYGMLD